MPLICSTIKTYDFTQIQFLLGQAGNLMENEIKDKWNEIITYMRDTYNINGVLFRTWINRKKIQSCFSGIHRSYYKSSTGCPFYLSK